MLRIILTVGVTGLLVTASPLAHAQTPATAASSTADLSTLTDMRINVVKAALQLTPDQEKYWPAIEDAIRGRAKDRQVRVVDAQKRITEIRESSPIEVLRDRDPVDFMERRANALAQRAADLKKIASAWQPLYKTLTPDQKKRMAFLTVYVLREMSDAVEQRSLQSEDEEED